MGLIALLGFLCFRLKVALPRLPPLSSSPPVFALFFLMVKLRVLRAVRRSEYDRQGGEGTYISRPRMEVLRFFKVGTPDAVVRSMALPEWERGGETLVRGERGPQETEGN